MHDPATPEPLCAEEWHLADAGGRPLRVGATAGGEVWLNSVRLAPGHADELAAALARAACCARVLAMPPGLARALAPGRRGSTRAADLAAKLGDAIRAGEYAPGAALPTAADLNAAVRTTLNQGTVDKAAAVLTAEGLAEQGPDGRYRVAGNVAATGEAG